MKIVPPSEEELAARGIVVKVTGAVEKPMVVKKASVKKRVRVAPATGNDSAAKE